MISYVVLFSDAAEGDLAQLLTYLVPQAGERVARAYVDKLIDYCTEFATFPERGLRRDDVALGLRIVGYRRRATIAFRVKGDTVTILRIYHGGKDIDFISLGET